MTKTATATVLTIGTVAERIGDESLTRFYSPFVHRKILQQWACPPPDAESPPWQIRPIGALPLTFAYRVISAILLLDCSSRPVFISLTIPNSSLIEFDAFELLH